MLDIVVLKIEGKILLIFLCQWIVDFVGIRGWVWVIFEWVCNLYYIFVVIYVFVFYFVWDVIGVDILVSGEFEGFSEEEVMKIVNVVG